jgi:hypothetical protein
MQPYLGIPTREGVSLHCLTQCYLSFTGRVPSLAPGMESKLRGALRGGDNVLNQGSNAGKRPHSVA